MLGRFGARRDTLWRPAGTNVSLAEPWTRSKRRLRGARRFASSGSPEYLGAGADGHPPRPAGVSEVGRKLHRLVRACKSIPDSRSCRFQEFSAVLAFLEPVIPAAWNRSLN